MTSLIDMLMLFWKTHRGLLLQVLRVDVVRQGGLYKNSRTRMRQSFGDGASVGLGRVGRTVGYRYDVGRPPYL